MRATNITKIFGLGAFFTICGQVQAVEAQDLASLTDCAVISATTEYRPGDTGSFNNVTIQIVPGVGSVFNNNLYASPIPSRHRNPRNITCQHKHTIPITNGQVRSALNEHLEKINASIAANTVEVQQTVAQSFAIQIDVLAAEISEIRSLLSGVDEQDAAVIGARIDSLEARLDALTDIANN